MRLNLIAVGRLKQGPERELCARYAERFNAQGRHYSLGPINIIEIQESKASSRSERIVQEASLLSKKLPSHSPIITLDERGKHLDSKQLSGEVKMLRDQGASQISLIIGGPDGVCSSIKNRATLILSLSAMTLPHAFARILLLEQLYRSVTIMAGHPYHRE
ncbi:MAG: 23S rRNA (pseudouridine(1915)-N(3))-methyltransferase RlmH [Pseudomonadota bacterium]